MIKNYRYILDKSSRKFICPKCHKKRFVRFIDNETKEYTNEIDGRCDRENSCGYFKKPENNFIYNNKPIEIVSPPTSFHSRGLLAQFCCKNKQNNFIKYLLKHFDTKDVIHAIETYHIGTSDYWANAILFWQIDTNNNIRGGKIMLYNCDTGNRVKEPYNHVYWLHKQLKLNDFVLHQCLFGLHLIKSIDKYDVICVVESEKTAIIMSIIFQNYVWLATGGIGGFKQDVLQPLKNYKVIAYPDKNGFEKWNKEALRLNKIGFNIQCSNLLENIDIEDGGDLVDFLQANALL